MDLHEAPYSGGCEVAPVEEQQLGAPGGALVAVAVQHVSLGLRERCGIRAILGQLEPLYEAACRAALGSADPAASQVAAARQVQAVLLHMHRATFRCPCSSARLDELQEAVRAVTCLAHLAASASLLKRERMRALLETACASSARWGRPGGAGRAGAAPAVCRRFDSAHACPPAGRRTACNVGCWHV